MSFKRRRSRKQKTFELGRTKDDGVTNATTGLLKGQIISHNESQRSKKVEEYNQWSGSTTLKMQK